MFNIFKKEEVTNGVEIPQPKDWTKDLKRNQLVEKESEQMSFLYDSISDFIDDGTKLGLSSDHLKILKICEVESSALELMKILKSCKKKLLKNLVISLLIIDWNCMVQKLKKKKLV